MQSEFDNIEEAVESALYEGTFQCSECGDEFDDARICEGSEIWVCSHGERMGVCPDCGGYPYQ